jgi:hypothetical protein
VLPARSPEDRRSTHYNQLAISTLRRRAHRGRSEKMSREKMSLSLFFSHDGEQDQITLELTLSLLEEPKVFFTEAFTTE